jgi:hypothetical protein
MADDGSNQGKKPYDPPRVTIISLRPEEAVLGHCKTNSSAGPVSASCNGPGGGGTCRGHGS